MLMKYRYKYAYINIRYTFIFYFPKIFCPDFSVKKLSTTLLLALKTKSEKLIIQMIVVK